MTPPPAVPGDEFDFDSMTPEEQLAWLESLARRQGVSEDELITAADMDVPIPENVEIDEPGYVPYSITGDSSARQKQPVPTPDELSPTPPESKEPSQQPEAATEETWLTGLPDEEAEAEPAEIAPLLDSSAEAMRWLDELAVKAETGDRHDLVSEEPGTFDWGAPDDALTWMSEQEAISTEAPGQLSEVGHEEVVADLPMTDQAEGEPPAPVAAQDDFLNGVDPMRWLESLAVRQGARPEELLTPADLSVPQPPPDTVVDEPGYVPFDASEPSLRTEETQPVQAAAETGAAAEPPEPTWTIEEESAQAQEAPVELSASQLRVLAALEEHSFGDDPLAWLEKLAAEPEADIAQFLTVEEAEMGEVPAATGWLRPTITQEDPLAGLTDEEIEQALARGQLTPEQELAWLKRQAARLAAQEQGVPEAAEPASELPPWIAELQPVEETAPAAELSALFDLEPEPAEEQLAGWATEVSSEMEAEVSADEPELQPAPAEEKGEPELQPAAPVEMPAWLLEEPERPLEALSAEDVPDWLRDISEEETPDIDESWLSAAAQQGQPAEIGANWLRALDRPVAPAAATPVAAPEVPPQPEHGERIPVYQERLNTAPDDHPTRLALARALWVAGDSGGSAGQYEQLIEASQFLPEVIGDLIQMLQARPREARLHRLLGDAYLRDGRLKEALHAYRRALEQL